MIESLHISGFKLFRDISLPKLGRLNLFVGENNSGKSCLLEAINLYAGRAPFMDVLKTALERSDDTVRPWDPVDLTEEGTSLRHPVFELFHRVDGQVGQYFIVEKIGDPMPLRVECRVHRTVTTEEGFERDAPAASGDFVSEGTEMAVPIYRGGRQVALITSSRLLLQGKILDGKRILHEDNSTVAFLPAGGFSHDKAAFMWDALVQGPGQELVLDWLRLLDPRIEDLAYIASRPPSRIALLKSEGRGRMPLRSMGDGMTKLFHIALAVASAAKGILLIDEFENGLHWTVQDKLWKVLAKAAREFNVQVFCTSHSRDCIESFTAAVEETESGSASIYRLERKGDDVLAIELPLINVDAAIREHEEVR
jgi:hypothetical protein